MGLAGAKLSLIGVFLFLNFANAGASLSLPPKPHTFLYSETKSMSPKASHALENLLAEHQRLTGDEFRVVILNLKKKEAPEDWIHQIFDHWKIGKQNKNSGILIVIYKKSRDAQIEVGYGLEAVLPIEKQEELMSDFVDPELNQGHIRKALTSGIYHILEAVNSPLILSGKATEIIQYAGLEDFEESSDEAMNWSGWIFLFFIGIGIFGWIAYRISAKEAHFTSTGWFRVPPIDFNRKRHVKLDMSEIGGTSGHW